MSTFTMIQLTIPIEHAEAANRCAAILDFDTGGTNTFGSCRLSDTGQEPATHLMASTPIKPHYIPVLQDPARAMAALTQLAEAHGRDLPVQADVEAFCNNVLVGEQPDLVRIVVTEEDI